MYTAILLLWYTILLLWYTILLLWYTILLLWYSSGMVPGSQAKEDLNRDQTSPRCRDRPVELITDGAEAMKQLNPCWF